MAIWKWYWSEISVAVLTCSEYNKRLSIGSLILMPLVILVMHPKMHAIHVFERPQTSKLISSFLMIAIQYMLWNLFPLKIKIRYCVSCEKK